MAAAKSCLFFALSVFLVYFLQRVSSACVDPKCTTCSGTVTPKCKTCYIGDPDKISYRGSARLAVPTSGKCTDYKIANCTKYGMDSAGNPTTCQECLEGYVLSDNKCLDCSGANVVENCYKCTKSGVTYSCSECKDGFYLQNNQCVPCPQNCAECKLVSGKVECESCERSYGLKPDKTGCAHCMFETSPGSSTTCDTCTVDNAGQFVACIECGGYFKDGKCISDCDSAMANCDKCEDTNGDGTPEKCLECREKFALVGVNACEACSGIGNDCYGCMASDRTKCNQCYWHAWKKHEFWVVRKDGSDCTKCMPKCEVCLDDDNNGVAESCTQCLNGTRYFLQDGQCQDCSDVQCGECYGEQTCTACMSGYKLGSDGKSCVMDNSGNPNTAVTVMSPLTWLTVVSFTTMMVFTSKGISG